MNAYGAWHRTWGEVGLAHKVGEIEDDYGVNRTGIAWRLTLSTGFDCFNLGIAIRRPTTNDNGAIGIGFLFFLVKLEWWPRDY